MTLLAGPSAGAGVGMDWDLSQAHASFLPGDGDHKFGYKVAFAGDVNGDGLDDILISARHSDGLIGYESGRTYLFLGRTHGWSTNLTASEADASFYGEAIGDNSGYSVAGVGDLDGDGLDDFVISSPSSQNPFTGDRGRAYLFYGNASGWPLDTNLSGADQTFNGGFVAAAGDVNGDGHDDFVVGKEWYHTYAGSTTIYFGSPDRNIGIGVTFSGEEYYEDYSGLCVAGAGDVNGDGYDDVLVGSRNREGGGASAGKTYLVLGRESGWPYWLKYADASFVGTLHDASGTALAGVGDVNGDGFDDFLINAYYNRSHGIEAGMTHLFLGRAEAWETNTSLSSSDASFYGELPYDWSGRAVAAAGDVDDDGYDDFLIGSPHSDESGEDAGQVYLVLGRPDGWAQDMNISDAADASFLGEAPQSWTGMSVAGGGDANGDGTDDVLIGAHNNLEDDREFGKAYLVLLDYAPPMLTDRTPPVATTGDRFTISVDATDTSGVADIAVEHWFGDAPAHTNESMVLVSGDRTDGTWALDVAVPPDSLEPLHYFVSAVDATGLWSRTAERTVNVTDDDAPAFEPVGDPATPTTGEPFVLKVNVTDNIGVEDVYFEYKYGWTYKPSINASMIPASVDAGGNGTYVIDTETVPLSIPLELFYRFLAVDAAGNWNSTFWTSTPVIDNDPPWLEADLSDAAAFTGTPFELAVNASDNIWIRDVYAEYWFGDDEDNLVREPMTRIGYYDPRHGTSNLTIQVPLGSTEPLSYRFSFSDNASNPNASAVVTVDVVDNVPPVARAGDDVVAGMREDVTLDGSASTDNVGIVRFTWTLGDLVLEGPAATHAFDAAGIYELTLTVEDTAGNAATDTVVVTVLDTEPPVADAGGDIEVYQGASALLDGSGSTDNVAVVGYRWLVPDAGGGNDTVLTGPRPDFVFRTAGVFVVTLHVTDAAGNNATDTMTVTVLDTEPPVARAGPDVTVAEGATVTLDGTASTDNVGISAYLWSSLPYLNATGANVTWTPAAPGVYVVTLEVRDPSGRIGQDQLTVMVLSRAVTLQLGPFLDGDGAPVGDATVTVTLAGTSYTGTTDGTGWAAIEVPRADVTPVVTVVVTKDGWRRLEYSTGLDGEWRATADIPPMEREVAPGWEGSALAVAVAVVAVAAVAVVAVIWWRRRAGG